MGQAYLVIDKNEKVIKMDQRTKMLCIFDRENDAKKFIKSLPEVDSFECEIVIRTLKFYKD